MKIKDKKKFKRSIILAIAIILLLLVFVISIINNDKEYDDIKDFKDVKEVLEYLGCNYIRAENLNNKEEYDQKIYVKFNKNLYENENSNERFFNNLIQMVAKVSKYKSIILYDAERNITIKIKCDTINELFENYYINEIEDYFTKQDSNNNINNFEKDTITNFSINSSIINEAINKKWMYSRINFGTEESKFNDYHIYFDEGIEVKTINDNVFNIIFNSKYNDEIINNIKVGTSLEYIKEVLGEPTYEDESIKVIGYKNKNIYIFFTEEEVSVYRVENEYTTEFYELIEKFINNEMDFQSFTNQLTTLWIDYDELAVSEQYYILTYTLKGVTIQVSPENKDGIHLYSNYLGFNKNEDIQKFINSGKVHISTDTNLVFKSEIKRASAKQELEYSYNINQEKTISKLFYHYIHRYDDGTIYKVNFLSKDGNNPNNELKEEMNSYIWFNDTIFLYGKTEDGIYAYDVVNREKKKLLEGKENYQIKAIEDGMLKYDDKAVEIR